jgi:hypothetical protein
VDAAGHATTAAALAQATDWPRGTVTAIPSRGQLLVVWDGRTRRAVSLTAGAEVLNPGTPTGVFASLQGARYVSVKAPCSVVPDAGAGFLARVVPATVKSGQTAWLQLRIPGTRLGSATSGSGDRAFGTATVTFPGGVITYGLGGADGESYGTVSGSRPLTLAPIVGVAAFALKPTASGILRSSTPYRVSVTLRGPTGTRRYRLTLRIR